MKVETQEELAQLLKMLREEDHKRGVLGTPIQVSVVIHVGGKEQNDGRRCEQTAPGAE